MAHGRASSSLAFGTICKNARIRKDTGRFFLRGYNVYSPGGVGEIFGQSYREGSDWWRVDWLWPPAKQGVCVSEAQERLRSGADLFAGVHSPFAGSFVEQVVEF